MSSVHTTSGQTGKAQSTPKPKQPDFRVSRKDATEAKQLHLEVFSVSKGRAELLAKLCEYLGTRSFSTEDNKPIRGSGNAWAMALGCSAGHVTRLFQAYSFLLEIKRNLTEHNSTALMFIAGKGRPAYDIAFADLGKTFVDKCWGYSKSKAPTNKSTPKDNSNYGDFVDEPEQKEILDEKDDITGPVLKGSWIEALLPVLARAKPLGAATVAEAIARRFFDTFGVQLYGVLATVASDARKTG